MIKQPELDRDGASKAIFFQTGGGAIGLLQIIGPTNDPRDVKVRYKLLNPQLHASASRPPDRPPLPAGDGHI